jgi:lipopolysaccharide heptosyltransferase II
MSSPWKDAKNVLAVRLDGIGDVLMTAPAIAALKRMAAGRRVTLLASSSGAEAARVLRDVDEVICYDSPWVKATVPRVDASLDRAWLRKLRDRRFDAVVIFTVFSQSPLPAALTCLLADIPARAAYCRENPYHLLTDWLPEPDSAESCRHEVSRQLDLVAALGDASPAPRPWLSMRRRDHLAARKMLSEAGIDVDRRWLVLHPGATAQSRRYPAEQFAAAAAVLASEHAFRIIVTGSIEELDLCEGIAAAVGTSAVNLAGRLSFREFAALLRLAPLVVSNNTSAVHLASAVGTPVVDLYALTNPQHTPWQVAHRVLFHPVECRNCFKSICPAGHHDCLVKVPSSMVVDAAMDLWGECEARRENQLVGNSFR